MKLKDLRIEKKMTQQEVADLVGISLRSYKSYENDEDKKDTINMTVSQIAKALQIPTGTVKSNLFRMRKQLQKLLKL